MPAFLDLEAYANLSIPSPNVTAPRGLQVTNAFVDSMATFWIVDSAEKLYTITNPNPGFTPLRRLRRCGLRLRLQELIACSVQLSAELLGGLGGLVALDG